MLKTIFFDNDGVLVDTEKYFYQSTKIVLADNGIELTEEKFVEHTLVGNEGGWKIAREMNFTEAEIDKMRIERNKIYDRYLTSEKLLIEGVDKVLEVLSQKYNMGVVTSSKRIHFDTIHRNTGILKYFDFFLTREDYVKSKPSPEPYLKALELSKRKPDECLVVEDSERGLIAAYDAGIRCAVIPHALTEKCDFSKAWVRLNNIMELPALL
jgi:HAD superfamily hydrolase (TIGR01509 family)